MERIREESIKRASINICGGMESCDTRGRDHTACHSRQLSAYLSMRLGGTNARRSTAGFLGAGAWRRGLMVHRIGTSESSCPAAEAPAPDMASVQAWTVFPGPVSSVARVEAGGTNPQTFLLSAGTAGIEQLPRTAARAGHSCLVASVAGLHMARACPIASGALREGAADGIGVRVRESEAVRERERCGRGARERVRE